MMGYTYSHVGVLSGTWSEMFGKNCNMSVLELRDNNLCGLTRIQDSRVMYNHTTSLPIILANDLVHLYHFYI